MELYKHRYWMCLEKIIVLLTDLSILIDLVSTHYLVAMNGSKMKVKFSTPNNE